MINFDGIYSNRMTQNVFQSAKGSENDDKKDLQTSPAEELSNTNDVTPAETSKPYENMGLRLSGTRSEATAKREVSPEFQEAIDFYNNSMTSSQRHSVTNQAENNIIAALSKMEQDINMAYIECAAYKDPNIMVVVHSPYRHYIYPRWHDRLLNFDIDALRKQTTEDMDSLNDIRDKMEYIMEAANGDPEHYTPPKKEYDVDKIAEEYLQMSYEDFAAKYPTELEKCKYVTLADVGNMTETEAYVYGRAKAYAAAMLDITTNDAHNTHWDIQERKLYEALAASDAIFALSEFEYDGITPEGLASIESPIAYNAFETALIEKYQPLKPEEPTTPDVPPPDDNNDNPDDGNDDTETSIQNTETSNVQQKPVKRVVNGAVLIFNPDGTVYNVYGQRIK